MSELKTNKISTNDGNNVAIDNALGLKSYTTTQRDALTSVAGDTIYNTTTTKVEYYDGSAWQQAGSADELSVDYLVIAGGGGGSGSGTSGNAGAGGAGGYRVGFNNETNGGTLVYTENPFTATVSTSYTVTIGAGGAGTGFAGTAGQGTSSVFATISTTGGGGGGDFDSAPSSGLSLIHI